MESIRSFFYKKKLITNCAAVKEYDFYCPENIFILGIDKEDELKKFLDIPYKNVNVNISKYLFSGWIRNFEIG